MKPQTSSAVTMNFQAGAGSISRGGLTQPRTGPSGVTSMGAGPNQPDDERRRSGSAKSGQRAYIDTNDYKDDDPAYSGGGGY